MYDKCLICNRPFERAEPLENAPAGRRMAYDPARGRLWAICRGCKRWSLAPIESRWETLEAMERLVRDRGRLLAETDNISLLRAGRAEIVRVGRAGLAEEAWWRYGRELRERRHRHKKLTTAAAVGAAAAGLGSFATGGMSFVTAWLLWDNLPHAAVGAARWLRFGRTAWRGQARCGRCLMRIGSLRFRDRGRLGLSAREGQLEVTVPCGWCRRAGRWDGAGCVLPVQEGAGVLGRTLAYHHFSGASGRRVREASRLIEVVGGPAQVPSKVAPSSRPLDALGRVGRIALEIAVHEERERRLLEMEVAELEAHWREEEALAEIIDGELTPLPSRPVPLTGPNAGGWAREPEPAGRRPDGMR